MVNLARTLAALSGILFSATAYLHYSGLEGIIRAVADNSLPPFLSQAIPMLWQFFSWHLLVLAVPMFWASIRNPTWFLPFAIFCGVVVFGDFIWVYSIAGWFPGTVMLLSIALCLLIVSIILNREDNGTVT